MKLASTPGLAYALRCLNVDKVDGMAYQFGPALREKLISNLAGFERTCLQNAELRTAAVNLVITQHSSKDQACILLTRRPATMRRHAGQFALPGGRLDDGETLQQAALRELHEEMGVELSEDHIVGQLDDYPTRSGFAITPFVVWGGAPLDIVPDPEEVARVFEIPFDELDGPEIPYLEPQDDHEHPILSAPLATIGDRVFAPTAAMLYQFREVAMNGRATRVAHFDQPHFARR